MATRTQGSVTAYAVSLALFVILFVFSFILAIIFKTQVTGAQIQAQEAAEELAALINTNEKNRPEVLEMKVKQSSTGTSMIGQLLAETTQLKQLINASPRSTPEAIRSEAAAAGVELGQTLIAQIRSLRAEKVYADQLVEQYKVELDTYAKQVAEVESQKTAKAQEYEKTVNQLNATLASLQADVNTYRSQVDAQRQQLEKQFVDVRAQTQQSVNDLRSIIEQKDQQIDAQRKRLEELTGELASTGKGDGPDLTRQSDGIVTSTLADESLVYIDRGRADQIVLGMTFEVFDDESGVVIDEFGSARGKATIEVIRMSDRSSLTRVVRIEHGQRVDENDLIANVVYDPNVPYKFYVFGEFDIDTTGQVTASDRRRVETMITQWGGQLVNKLSYNTDFLVLGQEPDIPEPLPDNVFDPTVIERHAAKRRKYEAYQTLITQAKALSIPILNQNRFLALVGYYQR